MRKLRYKLKELLTFTRAEKVGVALLLTIVLFVLVYPLLTSQNQHTGDVVEEEAYNEFKVKVDKFYELSEIKVVQACTTENSTNRKPLQLAPFDPNTADSLTYLSLGFSPKQVKSILLYRSKGGFFSKPEDFKKLYVVTDEKYEQLKDFIRIAGKKLSFTPVFKVEINSADTTDFKKLRGIGSYYAKQLVAYRSRLGGFTTVEQMMEVRGIDSLRFSQFSSNIIVDSSLIVYLPVNTATEDRLKKHPYIAELKARQIVRLRKVAPIVSIDRLISEGVFTALQAERVLPYLQFE